MKPEVTMTTIVFRTARAMPPRWGFLAGFLHKKFVGEWWRSRIASFLAR